MYLSKEVADDHVGHGMSPAADLKQDIKTTFSFNLTLTFILDYMFEM